MERFQRKRRCSLGVSFALALILLPAPAAVAEVTESMLDEADRLHNAESHARAREYLQDLLEEASSDEERAEVLWRLTRAHLNEADLGLYAGDFTEDSARSHIERGIEYAGEALSLDPQSGYAYFWRGASRGKTAELIGVLNALFLASDIRDDARNAAEIIPEESAVYYLASQVYEQAPGPPLAFGDIDKSVSYARRSIDLHEAAREAGEVEVRYWDYYNKLAIALMSRDWNEGRRERNLSRQQRQYERAESAYERAAHFESQIDLPNQSDREEARGHLEFVIEGMSDIADPTVRNERTLEDARRLLSELGG